MQLYKKKNELTNHLKNKKSAKTNFPFDLLNKSNNRYAKNNYNNKNKSNLNQNTYINNYINNNKNIKTNTKTYNKSKDVNINKTNYINNYSNNKKQIARFSNHNITNVSYINTSKINKMNKIHQGMNPINTYIINTLNVSEKEFLKSGIPNAKSQKIPSDQGKDLQNEINILIKEKEEFKDTIKKQKKIDRKIRRRK